MTIYVDQMFLENFIMNYIILYITSFFSGGNSKWYKICFGAAIGSLYVILSYFFNFYDAQMIIPKLLLSVLMVYISYKFDNFKDFCKKLLLFYMITFSIGGAGFGLAYFFDLYEISEGGIIYIDEFPFYMIYVSAILIFSMIKILNVLIRKWAKTKEMLYNIEIKLFDNTLKTTAFFDSGHNVSEPITNYPVIIIEKEKIKEAVPESVLEKLNLNEFKTLDTDWARRVRVIPLSTINNEKDIKIGIRADRFYIYTEESTKKVYNVILIPCERKLSFDDSYHALISKNLI